MFGKMRADPGKGTQAENLAADYLKKQGATVIARNYSCKFGEIDLICTLGGLLLFVEVRLRTNRHFASSAESVDVRKQQRLIATANRYLQQTYGESPPACRFDVIAVSSASKGGAQHELEWLQDAFRPEW